MVSGINSGGIPPVNVSHGQHASKDAPQQVETVPATSESLGANSIKDRVADVNSIPQHLMELINNALSKDGAKQTATDISTALRGVNLSIANADPSSIPGLSSE